jgi:hypothetical protein
MRASVENPTLELPIGPNSGFEDGLIFRPFPGRTQAATFLTGQFLKNISTFLPATALARVA